MSKKKETFKPVVWNGFTTRYLIGDHGTVFNTKTGKAMKCHYNYAGYLFVGLTVKKIHISIGVHRLVAMMFIPNPENKPEVNHIDAVRDNNCVENLEWVTHQENVDHAKKLGHIKIVKVDDKTAHLICKMFVNGMDITEISNITGIKSHIVRGIKEGKYCKEISKKYKIPEIKPCFRLTAAQVQQICDLRFKGLDYPEIAREVKLSVETVRSIFKTNYWSRIVGQYVYPSAAYNRFNGIRKTVDDLLIKGINADEIIDKVGTSLFSRAELLKFISRRRVYLHKHGHPEVETLDTRKWKHLYAPIEKMLLDGLDTKTTFRIISGIVGNNSQDIRNVVYKRVKSLKKRGLLPEWK
jgi:hypothetical protein